MFVGSESSSILNYKCGKKPHETSFTVEKCAKCGSILLVNKRTANIDNKDVAEQRRNCLFTMFVLICVHQLVLLDFNVNFLVEFVKHFVHLHFEFR